MKKLKLFLVDDHQILLDGIKALLKDEGQFEIIGEATRCSLAIELLKKVSPDIVITDIQMPEMSGIEFTAIIRKQYPHIKVLALSMSGEEGMIAEMVEAGISGYVLKNTGKEELRTALLKLAGGGMFFSEEVTAALTHALRHKKEMYDSEREAHITPREKEIIRLIAKEYSNKKISDTLFISERTVETHRKNIFRKTNTKSVIGLVKWAQEHKIL
jgi:two-component system, NarL family, nitrate/nitrite response regulator NarL